MNQPTDTDRALAAYAIAARAAYANREWIDQRGTQSLVAYMTWLDLTRGTRKLVQS